MKEIVTLIENATIPVGETIPTVNGCLYGFGKPLTTPYFVVKQITGPKPRKKYFKIIGHWDADTTEKATTTNRDALNDFIEITVRTALDKKTVTTSRNQLNQVYYLEGSLGGIIEGNEDGSISQEVTYFMPEFV